MGLMMNLIIDQGNSSAKIALFQGDEMLYLHKYEKFSEKMRGLGATMEKVDSERDIRKFILKVS